MNRARTLVILGTGGTIAGVASAGGDNLHYRAAQLPIEALLAAVPQLREQLQAHQASLVAEQILQRDSKDMEPADWLQMARRIAQHLRQPDVRAVILTHGTDTLEETAWFLHRVLPASAKPVILVSAMRPATAPDADGPQNLRDACALALADGTPGGVMAVNTGVLHHAGHVRKAHPYRLASFSSGEYGPLGWIEAGQLRLAAPGMVPLSQPGSQDTPDWHGGGHHQHLLAWTDTDGPPAPAVAWVTSHAGFEPRAIDALVQAGFAGAVVAATGNGTLHHRLEAALQQACRQGLWVWITTRCAEGVVVGGERPADLPAHGEWRCVPLPAAKARVEMLLQRWQADYNQ
ncbi:asparaginase [Corticibacter populi]|uniref:Asparaginase n=1 Tax=Corticibacter populi TaxID=1550736 RepID=A0A3M6QSV4_9BURK|nr:asparaginase [Corticibacter populi]RMX05931.1 asparaginase [Corticibacter populi]RZS30745.1 L-asparaginase [Corticibacter populi]